ncbi:hypothetical protein MANY_08010 [Mycolicibacterium anyangense]|uniref:Nudix hydrolase domain-containing protein n=2 Tax=Mycolicibacterium anyangense TaxID=1431246 RepID=A0A6N4W5U1_9MYCO|nr:hypothetical protein MANY_08010 [Mycolicibacterium anyangense]
MSVTHRGPSIPQAWQRTDNPGGEPPPEMPAATAVLARDGQLGLEVLLLRRAATTSFAAGAWVFPGGRVEPGDVEDTENDNPDAFGLAAARRAAVRETAEEAGVFVDADDLQPIAHWTPGPEAPKRFSTWTLFGRVELSTQVQIDGGEIVDHRWIAPTRALDEHRCGAIAMMPPTWMTLHTLSKYGSYAAAAAGLAAAPVERFVSRVAVSGACRVILWDGDAGYHSGDGEASGARHRLYLDDGGWRYERT